jgi:hypothetical protein
VSITGVISGSPNEKLEDFSCQLFFGLGFSYPVYPNQDKNNAITPERSILIGGFTRNRSILTRPALVAAQPLFLNSTLSNLAEMSLLQEQSALSLTVNHRMI